MTIDNLPATGSMSRGQILNKAKVALGAIDIVVGECDW